VSQLVSPRAFPQWASKSDMGLVLIILILDHFGLSACIIAIETHGALHAPKILAMSS
jgi:hypothetical protein